MSKAKKIKKEVKLANDHWDYINDLLTTHDIDYEVRRLIEFHYKTAMIHGYKHGFADRANLCCGNHCKQTKEKPVKK